jgi:hypothetical protein
MTDREHSAAVALRRLTHLELDGGVDDPISQLIRRLARDMPELLEEIVALIERRIAEPNDDGAAPRPAERVAPVKPEVAARFGAMADAERMGYAEFLEHMLDAYDASKRKTTDHADAPVPRRLVLVEHALGAFMREQATNDRLEGRR